MSNNSIVSLFNDFFEDDFSRWVTTPLPNISTARRSISGPAINVIEKSDEYEITLKAPGIDYQNLKIELQEKILSIAYEDQEQGSENETNGNFIRREWSTSYNFSRSLVLPKDVDADSIEAEYDKGIVYIHVKKMPEIQPKKVEVKIRSNEKSKLDSKAAEQV